MPATIDLAHAGGTTGEWAGVLREVFGEYRAPTGVAAAAGVGGGSDGLRAIADAGEGAARRAAAAARGQARPRRAQQRRRADRGGRPGRRPRGDLPGHPAHPRADRRRRARRGRRRDRPVDPLGQPPRAGARGGAPVPGARRDGARSWRAGSSRRTIGPACSPRMSRPSTRRRTSTSRRSWGRSSTSPSPTAADACSLPPVAERRR